MAIWFNKEDVGKKVIVKKKDGEEVTGILKGFDPVVKIISEDKQYRFLEAKIEEVVFLIDNPLDASLDIVDPTSSFEKFLNKFQDIKIDFISISFKEIEEDLKKLKNDSKDELELHSLYLELSKIFNSLKYASQYNQLEFKYDKTNRLLYQLDKLYEEYDDELIDKMIVFILDKNRVSYTDFFSKEPKPFYYYVLLYDMAYFFKKGNEKEAFIIGNLLFSEFILNDSLENEWLFLVKNSIKFKIFGFIKDQIKYYKKFNNNIKKLYTNSIFYLIYKFNVPLNDLQRIYLKKEILFEDEARELLNLLDIYISVPEEKEIIKINEIKKKIKEHIDSFEYLKAYNFVKGFKSSLKNNKEFLKLLSEVEEYYENWIKFKDNLPSGTSINYLNAKKAQMIEKNYEKAKFYFEESIREREEKFKSAIKDYIQMSMAYNKEVVLDLINKYKIFFEKEEKINFNNFVLPLIKSISSDRNYYLQNLNQLLNQISSKREWKRKYESIYYKYLKEAIFIYIEKKEYSKAFKYLEKLKELKNFDEIEYNKLAAKIFCKKDFQKAKEFLQRNIDKYSDQDSLLLLRELEKEIKKVELNVDYSIKRLDTNEFLNIYLSRCSFRGVSATKAKNKNFTRKDLEDVLNVEDIKSAKEKADRYLTAAVIVKYLEINPQDINLYLSKSLRFFANDLISQSKFDLGKNFLIASLSLSFNKGILSDYLSVLINNDILREYNDKNIIFENILESLDLKNSDIKKGLFYLYLWIPGVFEKLKIKEEIFKKEKEENSLLMECLNLILTKNIFYYDVVIESLAPSFLFTIDFEYFNNLKEIIVNYINEYKLDENLNFNERLSLLEKALNKMAFLKNDIEDNLTLFGSLFLRVLNKLESYVLDEIEQLKVSRRAKLSINSPIEKYSKADDIEFHLYISNEKNLSNAIIKKLEILRNGELLESLDKEFIIRESETKTITIPLNILDKDTFSILVRIEYFDGYSNEKMEKEFSISIDDKPFETIENPYTPDGQIVKDKKMFFGRDELMDNLIDKIKNSKVQALVLYGQKRVGKSTVFHYLEKELMDNFFIVSFSMGDINSEDVFFRRIRYKIKKNYKKLFKENIFDLIDISEKEVLDYVGFISFLEELNDILKEKNLNLLILIDEFTYLYKFMKENNFSYDFLKFIKSLLQKNLFQLGVIGQNSMPLFINEFPNELQVFKKVKISYLDKAASFDLLEKPILFENKSRYKDDSLEYIYTLTNGSPFYLQKIGYEIVEFLNMKKFNYITRAIVEDVINNMFEHMSLKGDFDNIISLGDGADEYVEKLREDIIIQIAKKSKNIGSVSIEDINIDCNDDLRNQIINTLIETDVVDRINGRLSLKVKLLEKFIQRKY